MDCVGSSLCKPDSFFMERGEVGCPPFLFPYLSTRDLGSVRSLSRPLPPAPVSRRTLGRPGKVMVHGGRRGRLKFLGRGRLEYYLRWTTVLGLGHCWIGFYREVAEAGVSVVSSAVGAVPADQVPCYAYAVTGTSAFSVHPSVARPDREGP